MRMRKREKHESSGTQPKWVSGHPPGTKADAFTSAHVMSTIPRILCFGIEPQQVISIACQLLQLKAEYPTGRQPVQTVTSGRLNVLCVCSGARNTGAENPLRSIVPGGETGEVVEAGEDHALADAVNQ